MLKNLLSLFGLSKGSKEEIDNIKQATSSLEVAKAISAHENWRARLEAFLAGNSTEKFVAEEICFDDRCDLGKWLHGPGKARLGKMPGFTAMLNRHQMFHYAASNVVALTQAGKLEDAQKTLNGPFQRHSEELIRDLKSLETARKD